MRWPVCVGEGDGSGAGTDQSSDREVVMGVGLTCLSDSQCFSRKPGSNDTSINGSATNFSRNESGGYTVQSSPASLTPASVPTETRTSPRGKSGG